MAKRLYILVAFTLLINNVSFGQNSFANTLIASDTLILPKANLNVMKWLEGHWRGEAFGGVTEEVWTPPLGGSMMCAFKLVVNNEINFYELVTIMEENESLVVRLKHFHSNLKGWEEKDETVDFRLLKIEKNKIFFDGMTFERLGETSMNIYVILKDKEGLKEAKFPLKKM